MVDMQRQLNRLAEPMTAPTTVPGRHSHVAHELRTLAQDIAGRLDRDELTLDEEARLAGVIDEAVAAALPRICAELEAELSSRVESLPLHARLALLNARQRRLLGLD